MVLWFLYCYPFAVKNFNSIFEYIVLFIYCLEREREKERERETEKEEKERKKKKKKRRKKITLILNNEINEIKQRLNHELFYFVSAFSNTVIYDASDFEAVVLIIGQQNTRSIFSKII